MSGSTQRPVQWWHSAAAKMAINWWHIVTSSPIHYCLFIRAMWSGQDINYNTEKRVHVEQSYIQMLYVLQFLPVFTDFPYFCKWLLSNSLSSPLGWSPWVCFPQWLPEEWTRSRCNARGSSRHSRATPCGKVFEGLSLMFCGFHKHWPRNQPRRLFLEFEESPELPTYITGTDS